MNGKLLAQEVNIGGNTIQGPLVGIDNLGDIINVVMPFMYGIAGIILLVVLIWGGYDFILSHGDPGKIKSARAKITAGIIGFILLALSYFITRLVSQIFGIGQEVFQ